MLQNVRWVVYFNTQRMTDPSSNLENALKKKTERVKGVDMYEREGRGKGQ